MRSQRERLTWLQRACSVAIENEGNLLQAVALGLGIVEECSYSKDGRHQDVHDVILPADGFESNRIDKCVEEDSADSRDPGDREASRSELVRPDLAGVGRQERGPVKCSISFVLVDEDRTTYKAMS